MNNLLQSLSAQRLKVHAPEGDLKRLLTTVKDNRGHDTRLSDAFYDSLEGILQDLRAVTIDNHDAEAFLKPVSKIDYPDYYEIISFPMDFQTMLKKVKQKQYKSKREFAEDLELIWNNCFTYNTGDNHPLRLCATRLREKSRRLLKNITDRRDRLDPPVPSELGSLPPRVNGFMVNGHSRQHSSPPPIRPRPGESVVVSKHALNGKRVSPPVLKQEVPFPESPAFLRTPSGMATFADLDRDLRNVAGPSCLDQSVLDRLDRVVGGFAEDELFALNGGTGEKRKLAMNGDTYPRKKARTRSRSRSRERVRRSFLSQVLSDPNETPDPVALWWDASISPPLLSNGIPKLKFASSFDCEARFQPQSPTPPATIPTPKPVKKRKRARPPESAGQQPRSLLGLVNNNIRSLRRVRRTHDKFLALNLGSEEGSGPNGGGSVEPPEFRIPAGINAPGDVEDDADLDANVDERPWRTRGTGLQIGEQDADDCLHWMGSKILEHSGFQSTSKAALDVFTGVATEYFLNVGRTLRYLCDKYSHKMTAEEIILHTLFESGITHIRDIERYITEDVVRYGNRLTDLEKKLVNAYREVTAVDALDDDAFFAEDEEEDGELLMGNFADSFGEDFLGLRELGIASELGLSSLTIPKKLLKGKHKQHNAQEMKPKEPPPPYPPPPPFIPVESTHLDSVPGLLKPFYVRRFNEQASRSMPPLPPPFIRPPPSSHPPVSRPQPPIPSRPLSPTSSLEMQLIAEVEPEGTTQSPPPLQGPIPNPVAPPIALPDDLPNPARTKIGPLGQIIRPSGSSKKKDKSKKDVLPSGGYLGPMPLAPYPAGDPALLAPPGSMIGYPLGPGMIKMPDSAEQSPAPGSVPLYGSGSGASAVGQQAKKNTSPKKSGSAMPPVIVASA